jgi:DNA mismatch repair protein MutL
MIHILPDQVIDRIAAGEVVERPFSVVKELMENAVDAGASRIEVTLEGGGKKLVKVVDDGEGITAPDLQAVFLRHATSKLDRVEDLLHIASLGFRGEALASIGAVSHARVTSRPRPQSEGATVENRAGQVLPVRPAPSPAGTAVEVMNLFANIPVRLKFLKGDATELSHCVEAVTRILLAYPGIEVRLLHNGRSVLHCEKNLDLLQRVERCFGRDLTEGLVPLDGTSGRLRMTGYVGRPEAARKDRRRAYLFINGRYVRDKVVHAAIRRAFRERLPERLQPVYFINLSLPPEEVDVNVHPMKLEVRFRDGTGVFAGVLGLVEGALAPREDATSATTWVVREAPRFGKPSRFDPPAQPIARDERLVFGLGEPTSGQSAQGPAITLKAAGRYLQVLDTYCLFEVEEGIALVDQHALHERVLYQKLKEEFESGGILLQNLLVPAVVDLDRSLGHRLAEIAIELKKIGIEAEPFGESALKVTAMPSLIKKTDPKELARHVIDQLASGQGSEDVYLDLLESMACKAAVRAGHKLAEEELAELIAYLDRVADSSHCPHGRPTTILLTHRDLEEMFKRRGF